MSRAEELQALLRYNRELTQELERTVELLDCYFKREIK